ncbi:MAG: TIR domain-containing protein [Terriglobia bacterium]
MANIILVDDEYAMELVVENLRQQGHEVRRISSADDAIRDADRIARCDLVVLDLIMPQSHQASKDNPDGARSTGMLVYRELRRRRPELPILIYTANQDPAPRAVIEADSKARYVTRWSSPKFGEFISIIYGMLGLEIQTPRPRPFIVHGHDEKTKLEVKNYLQNTLGLPEPIILHEQPNLGRTLMEKFEDLAGASELAFVLLTPDDHFAGADDKGEEKRRARQNVILELGFFLGTLGRRSGRVFLLHKGPLDLPSDLSGVIYLDISCGIAAVSDQIRLELAATSQ